MAYVRWCQAHCVPSMDDTEPWFFCSVREGHPAYVEMRYAPGGDMWQKRQERLAREKAKAEAEGAGQEEGKTGKG